MQAWQKPDAQWRSYDRGAVLFDRITVPHIFARPARDLIGLLSPVAGGVLLDVGTGTGVGALEARSAMGGGGTVVGVDPSLEMLLRASTKGLSAVVVGRAPGLPHRDAVFDAVLASFVLSHIASCELALADMVRVLMPGGKLGVSAWGPGGREDQPIWRAAVSSFVPLDILDRKAEEALPRHEWLSDADNLTAALRNAGLEAVCLRFRDYTVRMSVADYIGYRGASLYGRFMRERLGAEGWNDFAREAAESLRSSFGETVEFSTPAYLAAGTKPA
ncbi:MAG: class I SAM-dependent methyltransferase [Gemmatimonadota bacterium]